MFHKEGYKIIVITLLITTGLLLVANHFFDRNWIFYLIAAVLGFFLIMVLQFFRNPTRKGLANANVLTSPVDGKVVVIEEVYEGEYFKDNRLQVSIFMSPINVHVTRYPAAGRINFSKYHPGKYLVAWHPKSSTENERTTVVVETEEFGEILYRQIAGALAKRIINYAQEGEMVSQGADSGFIRFGSRVDLYLPIGTKLNVTLEEKVKGAESVIASI